MLKLGVQNAFSVRRQGARWDIVVCVPRQLLSCGTPRQPVRAAGCCAYAFPKQQQQQELHNQNHHQQQNEQQQQQQARDRQQEEQHGSNQILLLLGLSISLLALPFWVRHPGSLFVPAALLLVPLTSGAFRPLFGEAFSMALGAVRWFWQQRTAPALHDHHHTSSSGSSSSNGNSSSSNMLMAARRQLHGPLHSAAVSLPPSSSNGSSVVRGDANATRITSAASAQPARQSMHGWQGVGPPPAALSSSSVAPHADVSRPPDLDFEPGHQRRRDSSMSGSWDGEDSDGFVRVLGPHSLLHEYGGGASLGSFDGDEAQGPYSMLPRYRSPGLHGHRDAYQAPCDGQTVVHQMLQPQQQQQPQNNPGQQRSHAASLPVQHHQQQQHLQPQQQAQLAHRLPPLGQSQQHSNATHAYGSDLRQRGQIQQYQQQQAHAVEGEGGSRGQGVPLNRNGHSQQVHRPQHQGQQQHMHDSDMHVQVPDSLLYNHSVGGQTMSFSDMSAAVPVFARSY